jgi:GNAT superfamily N-acetyltransferase
MIQTWPETVLKNGESVATAVILAPAETWHKRIADLLHHKGEMWRWQVAQLLAGQSGIESRFYLLHRDAAPFCNILTIERNGVGMLGHVWTKPEDRGQGAASQLMRLVMEDFQARGGRSLYLGTGFESTAFHIYRKQGFQSIEANSGVMAFFPDGRAGFEADYFAPGETAIAPLDWTHYATASALLAHENKARVRCAPLGVLRPMLCESPFLPILRGRENGGETRAVVLQKTNGAVVGLAAWNCDAIWPGVLQLDVFCHANFWHRGEELLSALPLPAARRFVIYDDGQNPDKTELLHRAGFEKQAQLKNRVARDVTESEWLNIYCWECDHAF